MGGQGKAERSNASAASRQRTTRGQEGGGWGPLSWQALTWVKAEWHDERRAADGLRQHSSKVQQRRATQADAHMHRRQRSGAQQAEPLHHLCTPPAVGVCAGVEQNRLAATASCTSGRQIGGQACGRGAG